MHNADPILSVVIPVFNEVESIEELIERTVAALEQYGATFEILTIDDGSSDGSYEKLCALRQQEPRLRVIRLTRNFGQSPALYAGFSRVRGEFVVMMDADLQNLPEDIPKLVDKLKEGYDMVSGYRENRKDSLLRNLSSRALNILIRRMTGLPLRDHGCAIKAFRREMVDLMTQFTHRCRYLPADVAWLGGALTEVPVRHEERKKGESKYGFRKLVRTAFDLFTGISVAPLQWISNAGWLFAFVGFGMALRVGYIRFLRGDLLQLESVIAIFFFIAGVQMVATGLMCEYVGRIYLEAQRKPYYVIREEVK